MAILEGLGLNLKQIRAAQDIMAEAGVPAGEQGAKLIEIAEQFKALKRTATDIQFTWSRDPEIIEVQQQIQDAVDAGDIARSTALLETLQAKQWKKIEEIAKSIELTPETREKLRKNIR
jgi:hypothetical protein